MSTKAKHSPTNPKKLPASPSEDAPFIEWALWCAEVGRLTGAWKVFPCVPGEKRPLHNGWQDEAAWDRKTVQTMWRNDPDANVGLAIQPGFVAIDADIYKPGAEAALDAFEADHGRLPDTLENKTPSGGYHLIYSTAKAFGNARGTLPEFGDVRGHGGLIVGPGSIFEGKRYKVENLAFPAPMPAHIEGMLRESKSRDRSKPDVPAPFVVLDHRKNVEYFTAWCAGKPIRTIATPEGEVAAPCIEGRKGNNTLAATGAMAHDYGLSPDVALQVALEHHNPRCEPPWDYEDYEKHFLSGYRSAEGRLGCRAPFLDHAMLKASFTPAERPSITPEAERFHELVRFFDNVLKASGNRERRAVRFRDTSNVTPVPWIIEGWLSQDAVWLMYGESEAFKTYIALNMLLCIATGRPWGAREGFDGYTVGAPRPVVAFAGESYRGVIQRIHAAIVHGSFDRKLVEENLIIVPDVYSLNSAEGLAQMADEIDAMGVKPAAIAVDTYNLALEGDEDNATDNKRALRGLRALASRYGAVGLAIDHVGHSDKSRPRGSSAKKPNSDGMILCERDNTTNVVTLTQTKNREDDKEKYRAAFRATSVALGHDAAGKPISNLAFIAIEPPTANTSKARVEEHAKDFIVRAVADALLEVLRANPLKEWSDRALAIAIAAGNDFGGDSKIRQRWLRSLRDKSSPVHHCYDKMKARWRYQELDTLDTGVATDVATKKQRKSGH